MLWYVCMQPRNIEKLGLEQVGRLNWKLGFETKKIVNPEILIRNLGKLKAKAR
jgi:hypothetical protein